MENRKIVIWALLTLLIAGILFTAGLQIADRLQVRDYSVQYRALMFLVVVLIQNLWLGVGIFAGTRKHKTVLIGMLWGFGCEAVVLSGLILYAASAHY